jgi:mannose-6-phosphate isomerase-like protein (cupin superfamily)
MMNRRETILGFMGLAAATSGRGAGTELPESLWTLDKAKTEKHPFGELTVFCDGKTDQLKNLVTGTLLLYPGQEPHPPHQHPEEEIMVVTEGHGSIVVGGKTYDVGPGAVMYSEGNHVHGVKNTSSKPFRFYYMKWQA